MALETRAYSDVKNTGKETSQCGIYERVAVVRYSLLTRIVWNIKTLFVIKLLLTRLNIWYISRAAVGGGRDGVAGLKRRWGGWGRSLGWCRWSPGSPPGPWRPARRGRRASAPRGLRWRTCRSSRPSSHTERHRESERNTHATRFERDQGFST